jgi:hypothetical protein
MRTCKLFCVLAALLAVFSLSASAMTAEAQAKAEVRSQAVPTSTIPRATPHTSVARRFGVYSHDSL